MKVTYLGEANGTDSITQFGFRFERRGPAVDVPDNHPKAAKFVNNRHFLVEDAPKELVIDPLTVADNEEIQQPPQAPSKDETGHIDNDVDENGDRKRGRRAKG